MTWPAGVETTALTWGDTRRPDGSELGSTMTVELIPPAGTKALTWTGDGTPMLDIAGEQVVAVGEAGRLELPVVDQLGWIDDAGKPVGMWAYRLTQNVGRISRVKYLQPRRGTAEVDFDKLPAEPYMLAPTRPVRNLARYPRPSAGKGYSGGNGAITFPEPGWQRITPNAPNADAFLTLSGNGADWTAGKTYTILGTIRVPEGGTNSAGTQRNSIWVYIGGKLRASVQAPGIIVPGEHQLRVTFTLPADEVISGLTAVRLYSGRDTYADWSRIMVVEGAYDGVFSDGDTPGWTWDGTPGASTSRGWPLPNPPGPLLNPDPVNMSGWTGGGQFARIPASSAPAGCPAPFALRLGSATGNSFDVKTSSWVSLYPGRLTFRITGWFLAVVGSQASALGLGLRWGQVYGNSAGMIPNGYSTVRPNLSPTDYAAWKWVDMLYTFDVPGGAVPRFTPNVGGGTGTTWYVAGLQYELFG